MLVIPSKFQVNNNGSDDEIYWTHCLHQILIFPNMFIPPFSFHIRTRVFHHAWLMTAIVVHFMHQWPWSHVKMWPKPACDIQYLIRKKSRLWAHLEQLFTLLVYDNRDVLTVQKMLNRMYISGFVNTICGTKICEMPKNKRTIWPRHWVTLGLGLSTTLVDFIGL